MHLCIYDYMMRMDLSITSSKIVPCFRRRPQARRRLSTPPVRLRLRPAAWRRVTAPVFQDVLAPRNQSPPRPANALPSHGTTGLTAPQSAQASAPEYGNQVRQAACAAFCRLVIWKPFFVLTSIPPSAIICLTYMHRLICICYEIYLSILYASPQYATKGSRRCPLNPAQKSFGRSIPPCSRVMYPNNKNGGSKQ